MPPVEVPIAGGETAKIRNPVTSAILDVVTIGIYGLFWYYYVNKELATLGRARGTTELGENPRNSVLALFPGGLVLVPAIISTYNTGERIGTAQRLTGLAETANSALLCVALIVFFPIGIFLAQQELNKVWETLQAGGGQLEGGTAAEAPEAPAAEPVEQQQPPQPPA